jgi:hypothetical protein
MFLHGREYERFCIRANFFHVLQIMGFCYDLDEQCKILADLSGAAYR